MTTEEKQAISAIKKVRAEKVKKAQDFAKKTVTSIEDFKDSVREKAEAVKGSAIHASKQADRSIQVVCEKAGKIKNDIKHGAKEISKDIHKAAARVSKELQ